MSAGPEGCPLVSGATNQYWGEVCSDNHPLGGEGVHVAGLGEVGRRKLEARGELGENATVERRLGFSRLATPGGGCL